MYSRAICMMNAAPLASTRRLLQSIRRLLGEKSGDDWHSSLLPDFLPILRRQPEAQAEHGEVAVLHFLIDQPNGFRGRGGSEDDKERVEVFAFRHGQRGKWRLLPVLQERFAVTLEQVSQHPLLELHRPGLWLPFRVIPLQHAEIMHDAAAA